MGSVADSHWGSLAERAQAAQPSLAPHPVSYGQVAALLAFVLFASLWLYAELLRHRRRRLYPEHEHAQHDAPEKSQKQQNGRGGEQGLPTTAPSDGGPTSPTAAQQQQQHTFSNCLFTRCLLLQEGALAEARPALRAAVEFGGLMLWYYVADRTKVLPQGQKNYSRDVLGFIFLGLTVVAWATSMKRSSKVLLLNRQQTEEWKGWMQVLFLLYHYFNAREIYNAIRVFIAGYVWMTGYNNFSYYYRSNDFCMGRFAQMMWRLNFLVTATCIVLQNSYMLYYICPMHTLFTIMVYVCLAVAPHLNKNNTAMGLKIAACFATVYVFWDIKPIFYAVWSPFDYLMGYTDPRKPTSDRLYEWFFRSSLDRYVWIHGMLCAWLHPTFEAGLARIDGLSVPRRYAARAALLTVTGAVAYLWYIHVYTLPKLQYNRVHPYTSWIPISAWVVFRNLTPALRNHALSLYGWLGCITLETYISQFHSWLATGMPDGQPKLLLTFFPDTYPLLNFAGVTAVYVWVSFRLFVLTNELKEAVVPPKAGRQLLRNAIYVGGAGIVLYSAAYVIVSAGGFETYQPVPLPSSRL